MSKKKQTPAEQTAAPAEQSAQPEATTETAAPEGTGEGEGADAGVNETTETTQAPDAPAEQAQQPEASNVVRLKHDSINSISHGGVEFVADEHGVFEIPSEHASELAQAFGLTAAE